MSRHSNGKNTFAVAGWVVTVAIALVIALAVGAYLLFRGDSSAVEAAPAPESAAESSHATAEGPESKAPSESASASATPAPSPTAKPADNTLILLDTSETA